MVESLNDYNYNGKFSDTRIVPEKIIKGIEDFDLFVDVANKRANCSCRWCLFGTSQTGTNCTITHSGCGFFWAQECNQCILCL